MDQVSKQFALATLSPGERVVVTDFFNWVLVFNSGVSFGLFAGDSAYRPWILSGVALAVCTVLAIQLLRAVSRHEAIAYGLVVGGALGNVIDRLRQGAVTDFLDFHAYGWHWPAFNFGDIAIVSGVALLLIDEFIRKSDLTPRE